ncbi:transcription factor FapR [Sporosarcina aquimarina]|uniref:transcription factor FapR n=1 Tax=Sporosarcina aquimarina TaxID=114975 RepID=UPI00204077B7|nr:transcription factor FapR [Sporosarcina aquimarina]MCM3756681.1 transcription factor FapR [Sporosarcina aquimarina]
MRVPKKDRQHQLAQLLDDTPFLTDEEIAQHFSVSVQTIRLDRLECGIPELRERMRTAATETIADKVKALQQEEVIGEIIDIELDSKALSILDITPFHVFQKSGIARGHHLFGQANSLAVAVLDDELALTAKSVLHFVKPVKAGDRVIARAIVREKRDKRTVVDVTSTVGDEKVFSGEFQMYRSTGMSQEEVE